MTLPNTFIMSRYCLDDDSDDEVDEDDDFDEEDDEEDEDEDDDEDVETWQVTGLRCCR